MALAIENSYGNIDLTSESLPKRYVHIRGQRLQPICRKLGIKYARAVVGFDGSSRYGYKPLVDGVVVSARSATKLRAAIEDREACAAKRYQRAVASVDVLSALFTLNRRAKRCRDLAQTYYQSGMHGFAKKAKQEKDRIYQIKGQALHYLVEDGRLDHDGYHRFDGGNWSELLVGDCYRFHRPCLPPDDSIAPIATLDPQGPARSLIVWSG